MPTPHDLKVEPGSSSDQDASRFIKASLPDVLEILKTDPAAGLGAGEVRERTLRYGPNDIPRERPRRLLQFLKKFWGLSAWMVELILLLSIVLHRAQEAWVASGLLVLNALISFFQDQRASRAVDALRSRLRVRARVLRDRSWTELAAEALVPGDIVRLRGGDFVPADAKIAHGHLTLDQSALTGESGEVSRADGDFLYSGSVARRGEATVVIVATGIRTFYGRTTELVKLARPRLHLEEVVAKVVRWLFAIVGVLVAGAMGTAFLRGIPLGEILPLSLVLLLGAVPVALPVMFTVSMAIGALELSKKGVLVTRLSAAEDAASVDVVCLDKTGTITTNRLSITGELPQEGFAAADVIRAGALASEESNQDPIDQAFLAAARKSEFPGKDVQRVSFTPFSPETRRTEAVVRTGSGEFRVMKGALRVVGEACGRSAAEITALEAEATLQASKGYRVLAVASSEGRPQVTLVGLVLLADLPRPDSKALIADLERLGVSVKMLTGDALPVAQEMARQVGLRPILRVEELRAALAQEPRKAAGVIEGSGGFAEVFPEDKFRVVQALQSAGHLVGMTGDGVNDAPALRQAEVGVAVSSATDVAKAASSVVLTTEGMTGILDVVRNGRVIYQRILTWILNKISRTILKTSFVTVAFLVTGRFVISAFGMMLLVFMTDFVKIALSTDRTRPSERPETWKIGGWVRVSVALGVVLLLEALGLLALGWRAFDLGRDLEALRTFSFLLLLTFAIFSLVSIREREAFWSTRPSRILVLALGVDQAIGLLLSVVGLPGLKPISPLASLAVLGYSAVAALLLNDLVKRWLIRRWVRGS